jgi:predicted subunit of tRNA(5-methylaminomethyl-2-thiouridylate) methyltransferase
MESVLKDLYSQDCPALTVSHISSIADECNISYIKALSFINQCRRQRKGVRFCLQQLIVHYRSDLS